MHKQPTLNQRLGAWKRALDVLMEEGISPDRAALVAALLVSGADLGIVTRQVVVEEDAEATE